MRETVYSFAGLMFGAGVVIQITHQVQLGQITPLEYWVALGAANGLSFSILSMANLE